MDFVEIERAVGPHAKGNQAHPAGCRPLLQHRKLLMQQRIALLRARLLHPGAQGGALLRRHQVARKNGARDIARPGGRARLVFGRRAIDPAMQSFERSPPVLPGRFHQIGGRAPDRQGVDPVVHFLAVMVKIGALFARVLLGLFQRLADPPYLIAP